MKKQGIVVLGAPRSGTTLLRRLLNAHPHIASPGETNLLSACAHFIRGERIAGGTEVSALSGLEFAGFSREETKARVRAMAFSFLDDYAATQGKQRWAEKTAFNLFYADEIDDLFGDDVIFICIQRHGFDVAVSLNDLCQKNGGYLKELHEYVQRYPSIYEAFGHAWVDLTRKMHDLASRRQALTIKYEDLAGDPHATMAKIFSYLGEPNTADLDRALKDQSSVGLGDWKTYGRTDVSTESVNRWRKLPKPTITALASICNSTLELVGYDAVKHGESPPRSGQRTYELGLLLGGMKRKDENA